MLQVHREQDVRFSRTHVLSIRVRRKYAVRTHQPKPEERSERRADGAADEGTEHEPSTLEDHREIGTEQQQRRGQRDDYGLQRRDCRRRLEQHLKGQSPRGFST